MLQQIVFGSLEGARHRARGLTVLRRVSVLLLALAVGLSACQSPAPPAAVPPTAPADKTTSPERTAQNIPDGGTAIRGRVADARVLNPFLSTDTASGDVGSLIFEGLTTIDPQTGAPVPLLAKSWESSADGLTYTFKLRDDVKWHDGQPFTADDVKFTYETIMDPKTKTVRKSLFEKIKGFKAKADGAATQMDGVQVLDRHTLRIELAESFCPFVLNSTVMGIVPRHILEKSADINTDEFNTKSPIGTGPFRFKEWVKDSHITLVRNENYWNGRPHLDTFVFKVVPNTSVIASQLKTGEIHIGNIEPEFLADMEASPEVTVQKYDGLGYTYVSYNMARPFFQDRRVRQALTHAIDRQKVLERVLFNQGGVNHANTPAVSWAYNSDISKFPYDPDKAKKLLADAGYTPGPDGMLRDSAGKAVKLTMHTTAGSKVREAFTTIAREQFKAVGVDVDVQLEESTAFLDRLNKTRDFDMAVNGWSLLKDPDVKSIFHSEEMRPGGFNRGSYSNAEMDRLLEQGRTLPGCDQAKRKEIYGKMDRLLAEDQPYNFGFSIKTLAIVNKKLLNVKPSTWAGELWNVHQWYFATGK